MRLEQYYSYAYAGELKAGQKVQVSIPALMTTVEGTVEAVPHGQPHHAGGF